jgi:hypothetical protein
MSLRLWKLYVCVQHVQAECDRQLAVLGMILAALVWTRRQGSHMPHVTATFRRLDLRISA